MSLYLIVLPSKRKLLHQFNIIMFSLIQILIEGPIHSNLGQIHQYNQTNDELLLQHLIQQAQYTYKNLQTYIIQQIPKKYCQYEAIQDFVEIKFIIITSMFEPGQKYEIQTIRCPYDPAHLMPKSSFIRHIQRCKAAIKKDFKQCPYDVYHIVKKTQFDFHCKICPSNKNLENEFQSQWDTYDDFSQSGYDDPNEQKDLQKFHKKHIINQSIVKNVHQQNHSDQCELLLALKNLKVDDKIDVKQQKKPITKHLLNYRYEPQERKQKQKVVTQQRNDPNFDESNKVWSTQRVYSKEHSAQFYQQNFASQSLKSRRAYDNARYAHYFPLHNGHQFFPPTMQYGYQTPGYLVQHIFYPMPPPNYYVHPATYPQFYQNYKPYSDLSFQHQEQKSENRKRKQQIKKQKRSEKRKQ